MVDMDEGFIALRVRGNPFGAAAAYHCHSAAVTTESSISAASEMLTTRTMMVLADVFRLV